MEEAFRSKYISRGKRNGENGEEVRVNDAETCQLCNMERKETRIFDIDKKYFQATIKTRKLYIDE